MDGGTEFKTITLFSNFIIFFLQPFKNKTNNNNGSSTMHFYFDSFRIGVKLMPNGFWVFQLTLTNILSNTQIHKAEFVVKK